MALMAFIGYRSYLAAKFGGKNGAGPSGSGRRRNLSDGIGQGRWYHVLTHDRTQGDRRRRHGTVPLTPVEQIRRGLNDRGTIP